MLVLFSKAHIPLAVTLLYKKANHNTTIAGFEGSSMHPCISSPFFNIVIRFKMSDLLCLTIKAGVAKLIHTFPV